MYRKSIRTNLKIAFRNSSKGDWIIQICLKMLHFQTKFTTTIGLAGHSEGGTIAFLLAGEGKTDFIISLAGTATDGATVLVEQNRELANVVENLKARLREFEDSASVSTIRHTLPQQRSCIRHIGNRMRDPIGEREKKPKA